MDSYEECRGPPRLHLLDKYYTVFHFLECVCLFRERGEFKSSHILCVMLCLSGLTLAGRDLVWSGILIRLSLRKCQPCPTRQTRRNHKKTGRLVEPRYELLHRIWTCIGICTIPEQQSYFFRSTRQPAEKLVPLSSSALCLIKSWQEFHNIGLLVAVRNTTWLTPNNYIMGTKK